MSELLLVNPRRKRVHRKRRTHRRMSALQRQYFGKRRHTRRHRRVELMEANPAKRRTRRRRSGKRRSIRHRVAARAQRLRGFSMNSFMRNTLMPSAIGAVGALSADVVLGYATPYLPTMLTSGVGATVAKLGAAVGIGMAAGMLTNRNIGEQVMAGAVTVVLYSALKRQVQASLPNLHMSGMGYAGPALAYPDRLGMYVTDQPAIPPAVATAIVAEAAKKAVGKTAPSAQTVGEYVSGYENQFMY